MGNHNKFNVSNGVKQAKNAHVIVCGNEKGGSGKTTTAMHVVVSLLKSGFKVATIDLDSRQKSLTRYIHNRRNWARTNNFPLEMPTHFRFNAAMADSILDAQSKDFESFVQAISEIEYSHDFILIDTPGSDGYLMRLAHSMADTLITPMNDSFVDLDVLGRVDPETLSIKDISHYAEMVRDARHQRREVDNGLLDWVVVRNRLSSIPSRNRQHLLSCVKELSMQLGFRIADGISERVIFREYFPMGLTALDNHSSLKVGSRESASNVSARKEVNRLVKTLRLPVDDLGRDRAEIRKVWLENAYQPVVLPDIFVK